MTKVGQPIAQVYTEASNVSHTVSGSPRSSLGLENLSMSRAMVVLVRLQHDC